jgi:hypothetical protein
MVEATAAACVATLKRQVLLTALQDRDSFYHRAGRLKFFGVHARLRTFKAYLAPLRKIEWGGLCEEAVRRAAGCAGLSFALNHRVAISNLVPIQPRS